MYKHIYKHINTHIHIYIPDDVYLIKLQREVLQNQISTRRMQISQIFGISKENTHENNKATDITEQTSNIIASSHQISSYYQKCVYIHVHA
jgi:siroheme synthase (precorrin-2 oxidase/ferrochelatase)